METILTRYDWEEYLVRLYFGSGDDYLILALDRAYRDLNRTLHGMGSLPGRDALYSELRALLYSELKQLQSSNSPISDQIDFDMWHQRLCESITEVGRKHGYPSIYVGQAQKWINMTFKYIFAMGEDRLPGFSQYYGWCHVPLDNILLNELAAYGFEVISCAWSRLNDYNIYLDRQRWVRARFNHVPMDVEVMLWQGKTIS